MEAKLAELNCSMHGGGNARGGGSSMHGTRGGGSSVHGTTMPRLAGGDRGMSGGLGGGASEGNGVAGSGGLPDALLEERHIMADMEFLRLGEYRRGLQFHGSSVAQASRQWVGA